MAELQLNLRVAAHAYGETLLTGPFVLHYGINIEPSIAEAVNLMLPALVPKYLESLARFEPELRAERAPLGFGGEKAGARCAVQAARASCAK